MLLNCGVGEESWESLGQRGDQTSQSSRKSTLSIYWKDWCWSWNSNTLAIWCEELTNWKRSWWWERLKGKEERGGRGWGGWVASLTQWTWVWANSRREWKTGKPSMLQPVGSQRVRHDWATDTFTYVVVQSLSRVQLLSIPWTVAHQASLSFTLSWSWFKFMPIELVMLSNHLILCLLLLPLLYPNTK